MTTQTIPDTIPDRRHDVMRLRARAVVVLSLASAAGTMRPTFRLNGGALLGQMSSSSWLAKPSSASPAVPSNSLMPLNSVERPMRLLGLQRVRRGKGVAPPRPTPRRGARWTG